CSILGQRISNFEIILVNDGSSDKVIDDFCKDLESTESGLIYIYQENQGSAVARNKGLDVATGDYIFFVDADDTLVEESFQKYLNLSEEVEIICFDYLITDGQNSTNYSLNRKMDLSNHKNRLYANIMYKPGVLDDFAFGAIWGKCFSRQFLEKNNIRFRPELRKTQDRIFMLEA
ncbi:TPA: glycosyltransferase, partial [Streptococcus suis]